MSERGDTAGHRIGIFAKTFACSDPDTVLRAVADCGIRHTQFNLASAGLEPVPHSIPHELATNVRRAVQHHEIIINALSGTCNLIDPHVHQRIESIRRLAQMADFCAATGIPILTLSTGTRDSHDLWTAHPDNQSSAAHADLQNALYALLEATAHTGVTLAFEPEPANVIRTAHDAATLLSDLGSSRLAVLFDAANLLRDGAPDRHRDLIEEACALLAGRIALAHAKDLDASGKVVAPGQGIIDFAHYLRTLRTVGRYTGPVIMHGLNPADVPAALAHLRGCD